jgi:hypothetical protein
MTPRKLSRIDVVGTSKADRLCPAARLYPLLLPSRSGKGDAGAGRMRDRPKETETFDRFLHRYGTLTDADNQIDVTPMYIIALA